MKTLKILFCATISTAAYLANAASLDLHHYPKELIYLGKPLQPGCFSTMGQQSDDNKYDLRECSTQNNKYKITYDDYLTKKGFYGCDWEKKLLMRMIILSMVMTTIKLGQQVIIATGLLPLATAVVRVFLHLLIYLVE